MVGIIETLAIIAIVIGVLKLLGLLIAPKETIARGKKYAEYPGIMMVVCLILAALVLYYLLAAGFTIVDIFAVMLFVNLLVGAALAKYAKGIFKLLNPKTVLRDNWVFILIAVVLMAWGIKEIFF